jgi:hypothetical protein
VEWRQAAKIRVGLADTSPALGVGHVALLKVMAQESQQHQLLLQLLQQQQHQDADERNAGKTHCKVCCLRTQGTAAGRTQRVGAPETGGYCIWCIAACIQGAAGCGRGGWVGFVRYMAVYGIRPYGAAAPAVGCTTMCAALVLQST